MLEAVMSFGFHFYEDADAWQSAVLNSALISGLIAGAVAIFNQWFVGKRLQKNQQKMDKLKTDYEAEIQRVTLQFQANYTYVAAKRMKALETFLKEFEKIRRSIAVNRPGLFNDDAANRKEIDNQLRVLWEKHRVSRLFLSKTLSEAIFMALHTIDELHSTSGEFLKPETMKHMQELKKELEQRIEAIIGEAQTIWETKLKKEEAPG